MTSRTCITVATLVCAREDRKLQEWEREDKAARRVAALGEQIDDSTPSP